MARIRYFEFLNLVNQKRAYDGDYIGICRVLANLSLYGSCRAMSPSLQPFTLWVRVSNSRRKPVLKIYSSLEELLEGRRGLLSFVSVLFHVTILLYVYKALHSMALG